METIIFTDGSSRGNPGLGGWGAIIVSKDKGRVYEIGGFEKKTTNNRMELLAVIESLKKIKEIGIFKVSLFSDSSYVRNGISKWIHGWQVNGWQTKAGKDVLNKDLWILLLEVSKGIKILWKDVPGHSGIPLNERADEIATLCADGKNPGFFEGSLATYHIPTKVPENFSRELSSNPSKNKKAYSYVAEVNGDVRVFSNWEECKKFVSGRKARFKKSFSKDDEVKISREFSR